MNHGPFACWNVLIARSLALFFGVFTFLNLVGELGIGGFMVTATTRLVR
jgi:hypothetical protein